MYVFGIKKVFIFCFDGYSHKKYLEKDETSMNKKL